MAELREIAEDELEDLVGIRNAIWPQDPESAADYLDWKRQAEEMTWLLASDGGTAVGAGIGIHGWHSPPGVGRMAVLVLPSARGRGTGSELLARLGAWLSERGCTEATAGVFEVDGASIAWAARRGFAEVGRNSILALDLRTVEAPEIRPPEGVEIVSWSEHPELTAGLYDVYTEAGPDIPGEDETEIPPFDEWLSKDMQGASDRPEATFVAVAAGVVVGYAKLSISAEGGDVAWHDVTGVKRFWRGRGVAGALKRAEIAWAKESGYRKLQTFNEERNEPIRRLNQRHGYRLEPGFVTVRGPIRAGQKARPDLSSP
jgi:GNAT superfamily N-acetyltransferase